MRSTARAQAAEAAVRRARGERISTLLCALKLDVPSPEARDLYKLLQEPPVGYLPELTANGGWFERVTPILRQLARSESGAKAVTAYFRCFVFPRGQQAAVLEFLAQLLDESGTDPKRLGCFIDAATAVLGASSPDEARLLYDQVLATVRLHRGNPASKAAALAIGRLAYSASRPNRQPTVYDEQAIANDIAAQLP